MTPKDDDQVLNNFGFEAEIVHRLKSEGVIWN